MDKQFLRLMAESYVSDFKDQIPNLSVDNCYRELSSIMDDIRVLDNGLYTYLHEMGRERQYRISYYLLDDIYENHEKLDDQLIEEIGVLTFAVPGFMLAVTLLTYIIAKIFAPSFIMRPFSKFAKVLNNIAQNVYKKGFDNKTIKRQKALEAIIYNRLTECSQKCGIYKTSDIGAFAANALTGGIAPPETVKNVECLTNCYLNFHVNTIALLAQQYKQCLINTQGEGKVIHKFDNIIALRQLPLSSACKYYHDLLDDYLKTFSDLLDVLFDKKDASIWIERLNNKLAQVDHNKNTKNAYKEPSDPKYTKILPFKNTIKSNLENIK